MSYSSGVMVISLPCTSGIRPSWILHAIERGFDGVFIASDGDECAYLPDCSERASHLVAQAQKLLKSAGHSPQRLKLAAICSVCAEPFTRHVDAVRRDPGQASCRAGQCWKGGLIWTSYDVLVVGAGIGGMESALKLGDMGYRVLLVEKEASVGGKMILLSKVFPTLDCASCISTPKMAASIHHPNVTHPHLHRGRAASERAADGRFHAPIKHKARFVDEDACTGCQMCETACTVAVPDQFNADLVARRAAYIAFPQAVPKKAVIERAGSSPCSFTCPAGIAGARLRVADPQRRIREGVPARPGRDAPGRARSAAPAMRRANRMHSRTRSRAPLPIRRLKRFVADRHYATVDGPGIEALEPNGHRVAIVGSGPAGLTAAWQLARKGYAVKIFEAARSPVASCALPSPRTACRPRSWTRTSATSPRSVSRSRPNTPVERPRGAPCGRLRRRPARDRDPALDAARRARRRGRTAS